MVYSNPNWTVKTASFTCVSFTGATLVVSTWPNTSSVAKIATEIGICTTKIFHTLAQLSLLPDALAFTVVAQTRCPNAFYSRTKFTGFEIMVVVSNSRNFKKSNDFEICCHLFKFKRRNELKIWKVFSPWKERLVKVEKFIG